MFKLYIILAISIGVGSFLFLNNETSDDTSSETTDEEYSETESETSNETSSEKSDEFGFFNGIQISSWKIYENKKTKNLVFSKDGEIIRELIYPK